MQLFQLLNFIFPRDQTEMMMIHGDDIQPNHMRGGIIFQKENFTFSAKYWRTDQGRKIKSI